MFEPLECAEDLREGELDKMVSRIEEIARDRIARQAFAADMEQEEYGENHGEDDPLDCIEDDEDIVDGSQEILIDETEVLEELPIQM